MEYTIWSVAPIVLLPFFAFAINAFIVKRFTSLAVFISCAAMAVHSFLLPKSFTILSFEHIQQDITYTKVLIGLMFPLGILSLISLWGSI